jgi:hypothetical protein
LNGSDNKGQQEAGKQKNKIIFKGNFINAYLSVSTSYIFYGCKSVYHLPPHNKICDQYLLIFIDRFPNCSRNGPPPPSVFTVS